MNSWPTLASVTVLLESIPFEKPGDLVMSIRKQRRKFRRYCFSKLIWCLHLHWSCHTSLSVPTVKESKSRSLYCNLQKDTYMPSGCNFFPVSSFCVTKLRCTCSANQQLSQVPSDDIPLSGPKRIRSEAKIISREPHLPFFRIIWRLVLKTTDCGKLARVSLL